MGRRTPRGPVELEDDLELGNGLHALLNGLWR
jgi:hypothetical protein